MKVLQNPAAILALIALSVLIPSRANAKNSQDWVQLQDGHLVYKTDDRGNRIPDFSTAGYAMSNEPIPDLPPIKARVPSWPTPVDDTARIQKALDEVGAMPQDVHGFRGTVMLGTGEFNLSGTLRMNKSGVVLSGRTTSDGRHTTLHATGKPHVVLNIGGEGQWEEDGGHHTIVDDTVPVGGTIITVDAKANVFHVGDRVLVQWNMTPEFVHKLGMDHITARKDGREVTDWSSSMKLRFDRRVLAVERVDQGQRLTLDAPLTQEMHADEHALVFHYTFPGRLDHIGVQDLSSEAEEFTKARGYAAAIEPPKHRDQPTTPHREDGSFFESIFSQWNAIENGWMRRVKLSYYNNLVAADGQARAMTFEDITADHVTTPPKRNHAAPFAFQIDGQQILMQRCNITSGHLNHVWATQARVAGPNVFRDSTAKGSEFDAGPHQRWATGTLYEQLTLQGRYDSYNQEGLGTGHGWAGAYNVLWNTTADTFQIDVPPGTYIWVIGSKTPVEPASLYEQQLKERLASQRH